MDPIADLTLPSALEYLRATYGYKQILVECGASTTQPYYASESAGLPFDTLLLSIYKGPIHPSCVGQVFPSLEDIGNKLNPILNTNPIETEEGEC